MMKKITKYTLAIIFMAFLSPVIAHSQITADSINASFNIYSRLSGTADNGGEITINQDSRIEGLLKQHFNRGGSGKNMKGWRIRIFRDNSREARDRSSYLVSSFKGSHPGIPAYRSYTAPYFYVSVGDFRTRDEAEKLKKELKNIYPGASLIEVTINFPPL